ncbi:MAG: NAD(P)-dependent alcohol dehydrogenase [Anaerolineae bacterium]|nr:NAD(P)-dependent alcohol dehydrogenase [Anaerolineae bacterium]
MKAIVYTQYGSPDVLRYEEVAKPTPADDEVLIKVYAASVNAADWRLMRADPFLARLMTGGFFKPKYPILGVDISGRVEAVGKKVKQFKPGDEVYVDLSLDGYGGFAEYACAREDQVALKPANLSFEEAATVPLAGVTALQGLRDNGRMQPGHRVLINGASGGVGIFAVQIAKALGAEVTAVCSTRKLDMVRKLGADHVIDYTREDFTKNGQRYDVILAVNGYHPIADYKRSLNRNGSYVMVGGNGPQLFQALLLGSWMSRTEGHKMGALTAKPSQKDLDALRELIEAGKVVPVIDQCYPLSETADAIRHLETKHARGKIVISVTH